MARLDLYISDIEKDLLMKAKKKTGLPFNKLLMKAFDYWINNNPAQLKDLAEEFHGAVAEMEAKQRERDTGDFLGSFDKFKQKMERIKEAEKTGEISTEWAEMLRQETERNYEITREEKKKRLEKRLEKYKKQKSRAERLAEIRERARKLREQYKQHKHEKPEEPTREERLERRKEIHCWHEREVEDAIKLGVELFKGGFEKNVVKDCVRVEDCWENKKEFKKAWLEVLKRFRLQN